MLIWNLTPAGIAPGFLQAVEHAPEFDRHVGIAGLEAGGSGLAPGLMRSRGISRTTLPSHCTNLNGGTSLATSIAGFCGQHVLQKADPGLADAGLAVGQAGEMRRQRSGKRAEHGLAVGQRNAADEMHDGRLAAPAECYCLPWR